MAGAEPCLNSNLVIHCLNSHQQVQGPVLAGACHGARSCLCHLCSSIKTLTFFSLGASAGSSSSSASRFFLFFCAHARPNALLSHIGWSL